MSRPFSETPGSPPTVVLTRPKEKAEPLTRVLEAVGIRVILLPAIAIEPMVPDHRQYKSIENLDQYHGVVCVSSHSAEFGVELLFSQWPQWPVGMEWFAVGPATKAVMSTYHLHPTQPTQQFDSLGLLALPELAESQVSNKKILILKGEGGLDTLASGLIARGALVDSVDVYRRTGPKVEHLVTPLEQLQRGHCHLITCYSGETLENLVMLFEQNAIKFETTPIVVISERVAELARRYGFASVLVAGVEPLAGQEPSAKREPSAGRLPAGSQEPSVEGKKPAVQAEAPSETSQTSLSAVDQRFFNTIKQQLVPQVK